VSLAYTLLLLAVLAIGVLAFLRWREAQPEFAPLQTKPDDPLMLEAMNLARERLPQFQDLLSRPYESALVKLNFVSNTNKVEHLWAEVLEKLESGELGAVRVKLLVACLMRFAAAYPIEAHSLRQWSRVAG
jgi:hypothetical protein